MAEVVDSEMNGEELTIKLNVAFSAAFIVLLKKTQRVWSTIDDLVKDGAHSKISGIHGEEEGCIRGRKIQGCSRCERFLGCNKCFLMLCLPQKRLWLSHQGRMRRSHGVRKTWNKVMIIIYHPTNSLSCLMDIGHGKLATALSFKARGWAPDREMWWLGKSVVDVSETHLLYLTTRSLSQSRFIIVLKWCWCSCRLWENMRMSSM